MLRQGLLRPSNLPKLALCSWFRPEDAEQSKEAARGTAVDTIYRQIMVGLTDFPDGTPEEIKAADWAACQTDQVADKTRYLHASKIVRCETRQVPDACRTVCGRSQRR